jgi:hypothetical protein
MKKFFIMIMMVTVVANYAMAGEKKQFKQIAIDDFTSDTQAMAKGTGDNHLAMVWWVPNEFWQSTLSRDMNTSAPDKKSLLDAISGVSLLGVVQADVSQFGAFSYYSKEEIEEKMSLSYLDADGKRLKLLPLHSIDPDLDIILRLFKPMLGAAMGSLGTNFHFYVLNDRVESSLRLLDPYKKGQIDIQLTRRDKVSMKAKIEMPINALFVPRKCSNGKDAHISWKYCPWTGKLLEE